ncbi:hypothetical protein TVAG_464060 [Trichomonas vaginalis G3]|uniref:Uncharacterized protein n=2 Tax=Trichomonas vaginalis (strain ATCC PRA-98 / G3) TaxID=412133 RepID=A2E258_TRIV3|nr:hypothetical protein TVAG_464060 [Trichomonas vaginalis G3]|eukprot:XP_001325495.1 hypothetical protein [Trichomonas vaginalis G3]
MIDNNANILDGNTGQTMQITKILEESTQTASPMPNWFLWTTNQTPFNNMFARVNKCFVSKQSLTDFKIANTQFSFGSVQDYELFLEQEIEISPAVKKFNINKLAQPFAQWVYKTFTDLHTDITPEEVLDFILNPNPDYCRSVINSRVKPESVANKFFSVYNQWRVYIPCFVENVQQNN